MGCPQVCVLVGDKQEDWVLLQTPPTTEAVEPAEQFSEALNQQRFNAIADALGCLHNGDNLSNDQWFMQKLMVIRQLH
jgi:aminoglycoside phosphotransferase